MFGENEFSKSWQGILESSKSQFDEFDPKSIALEFDRNGRSSDDLSSNSQLYSSFKRNRTFISQSSEDKKCVFCANNGEPINVVKSHNVRDAQGKVICPRLRKYTCPICLASGDQAHTIRYCPKKKILTLEDTREKIARRIRI